MIGRHLIFVVILFAAAVIPYAANNSTGITKWLQSKTGGNGNSAEGDRSPSGFDKMGNPFATNAHPANGFGQPNSFSPPNGRTANFASPAPRELRIESEPVGDLAEVIRFDVPPDWVLGRWPRVETSSLPGEPPLQGYRVAVVTGTRPDDIAGSLTYYFTPKQHIRRLAFQGTTGDPRRLIELATKKYELKLQPPSQPGEVVYQVRSLGQSHSELKIKSENVFRTDSLYSRYSITMEINNFAAK